MRSKERQRNVRKTEAVKKLRTCRIVLSDITLDSHVVGLYPKIAIVLERKEKPLERSLLCIDNKSKSLSDNVCLPQSKDPKKRTALQDERCIVTRNRLRNGFVVGDEKRTRNIRFRQNDDNLEGNVDDGSSSNFCDSSQPECLSSVQQIISDTSSVAFPNKSSDKTFTLSTSTYSSDRTRSSKGTTTEEASGANVCGIKTRLRSSKIGTSTELMGNTAEKNCLSQASSSGNDCNSAGTREVSTNNDTSETRDVSKQSATCMPHDNDLQSINDNITNSTASQQTEEERKDDQNDSCTPSNITDSNVENEASLSTAEEDSKTKSSFNELEISNRKRNKRKIRYARRNPRSRKNLPRIIANDILPQGTINVIKLNNKSQDGIALNSSSQQICLEQAKCNDNERNIKETDNNMIESINGLRVKECLASCDMSRLIGDLKSSESILKVNNNINLENKNLLNNIHQHKAALDRNRSTTLNDDAHDKSSDANSEETINGRHRTNRVQLSKLDINDNIHENDKAKTSKSCNVASSKNTSNGDTRDSASIDERCDISEPPALAVQQMAENQGRKRLATVNVTQFNLGNKRIKLDINHWLKNQTFVITSRDPEKSIEFSDSTINLNPETKAQSNHNNEIDLREQLIRKRFKRSNIVAPKAENEQKIICKLSRVEEKASFKEQDTRMETIRDTRARDTRDTIKETQFAIEADTIIPDTSAQEENHTINNKDDSNNNDDYDDDCISLFAKESFNESFCENVASNKANEPKKFLQSETPYEMSAHIFDKYMRQNAREFSKEFERCAENNTTTLRERKTVFDKATDLSDEPVTATAQLKPQSFGNVQTSVNNVELQQFIRGYCFQLLKTSVCKNPQNCMFSHHLQTLIRKIYLEDSSVILKVLRGALARNFTALYEKLYVTSLSKLSLEQILTVYRMIQDTSYLDNRTNLRFKEESKKFIIHSVIRELLKRHITLKKITGHLMSCATLHKNVEEFKYILSSVEVYVKRGEYWDTVKSLILEVQPDEHMVHKILNECVETRNFANAQDIKSTLLCNLDPKFRSILNEQLVKDFEALLPDESPTDPCPMTTRNSEECVRVETIASPDSNQMDSPQRECPKKQTVSSVSDIETKRTERKLTREEISMSNTSYVVEPIDNLSEVRSVYREQSNLWKFYVDLERFKKGLLHKDYDYVIDILKAYTERPDEHPIFVRSCCSILRAEVKRSEYHLKQIIQRTVQTDTSGILRKTLSDIGLDILNGLMDEEASTLALSLFQSLKVYGLPINAEFLLLSAEIYLANNMTLEAFDLIKNKNVICTSRTKWHVQSTASDEHVRNKIMYILMDLLCVEFIEHAFFLFQFLLKDQSSQYHPIDLSRYVDKLTVSAMLSKNTNLIREMGNLILKYTFALSTTPCRALVSTLIHTDEILAGQIYNYAEGIGIYSAVKLWPVTHMILNTDLTEEEIYLALLQLLKVLKLNLGQGIEYAKPQNIKVYLFLEVKLKDEEFACAKPRSNRDEQRTRAITNMRSLIKVVLRKRFDPPMSLMNSRACRGRICRVQSTSLLNYLVSEHYN